MSAVAAPRSIPTREQGYAAAPSSWWMSMDAEAAPELRWPSSIAVFDRMRRQDAQVVSVLRAVKLPLQRTTWRLDATGCREEVARHCSLDLGLPLVGQQEPVRVGRQRDRFVWTEHLALALLCLDYGHMMFEQLYRIDDDGWAHLRKLGPRMPRSIAEIKVASDGGLESIRQHPNGSTLVGPTGQPRPIPVSRLVAYVNDREGGNWVGTSLLRAAYKNHLIKDRLLRVQAQTIERNGMGVPTYTGANAEEDLAKGQELARGYRSGDSAGAAIPFGSKLELQGVKGDLPDANTAIRYHDEQIARAVLAHFLNLGTQTGSWALGTTFADFFTLSLQAVGQTIADTATAHVVEDLVDVNFGVDEPAPRVVFDEIGSRQTATAEALKILTDAGVLTADDDIEQFVRTAYSLPPKRPGAAPATGGAEPSTGETA